MTNAPKRGRLSDSRFLRAADFDGVETLWALSDFKCHDITFAEFVKRNADELVGMEKEIFVLALALDEAEALISDTGNCSFLHMQEKFGSVKSRQSAGVGGRSLLLWISPEFDT